MEEYCSGADWENRLKSSLPGYDPVTLMNRPMRTRLWGGVGAGGEKPPATRFALSQLLPVDPANSLDLKSDLDYSVFHFFQFGLGVSESLPHIDAQVLL